MAMRIGRVVMIGRYPIESRPQITFHLRHDVTGIGSEITQFFSVLGRNDNAELMSVINAAFMKFLTIKEHLITTIENAFLAFASRAVSLDVIQMMPLRIFAICPHLHEMHFDDDAPRKILLGNRSSLDPSASRAR